MSHDPLSLHALIVHRSPMCLLDDIIEVTDTDALAVVVVRRDNPFFEECAGLPAYCGLEMMAQAIAAIDGFQNLRKNLPPKIGFLLGSRKYTAGLTHFPEGTQLSVRVKMIFCDDRMFSFEGRIEMRGDTVARANLNVYAPNNPRAFLDQPAA